MNKPEQRDLDLTPFIESGFDIQHYYRHPDEWRVCSEGFPKKPTSEENQSGDIYQVTPVGFASKIRPRLNQRSVLDDYSKARH